MKIVITMVWIMTATFAVHAQETIRTPAERLVEAAVERTGHDVTYDGSYRGIPYPGGDVPDNIGSGPRIEDMLFEFRVTGHYRFPVEEQ